MNMNIPDIPKLLKYMALLIAVLSAGWAVVILVGAFGCALDTQVVRNIAEGAAREAARATVDGMADRLGVPETTNAVSPLQGMFGAVGVMVAYLVRKKWFPMGKR